ncbi:MAG: hypothetical protein AVDCRST_MAG56-2283 [uncultured Cytophagales bacterium]|uniref:Uncharacterized protein n=1 Tax=uncultured Cytophagales bacterium TaxID=158755 RepID=A0A6J4IS17_9SPHI|nr:MAG: hypothetical protein AVDCRST_MAG56-2283 [uncultured Cytophagales bacterium]
MRKKHLPSTDYILYPQVLPNAQPHKPLFFP